MKASKDQWNRWIDGDLPPEEAAGMDIMVAEDPALQGDQEFFARLSSDLKEAIPAERTPPFADFFNSQVQKRLWDLEHPDPSQAHGWRLPPWLRLSWAVPLGAAAILLFSLSQIGLFGDRTAQGSYIVSSYTPNADVHVEATFHADANAMVVRLTGVPPLPEGFDLELTEGKMPATNEDSVMVNLEDAPELEVGTPSTPANSSPF